MSTGLDRFVRARRHDLAAWVGRSEHLYFAYQLALHRPARTRLVNDQTDLCIEAPPGSGNSFFVHGFSMANPGVRLAHHHHVSAQVHRAGRLGVPTLLIVRKPGDCVLSRAVSLRDPTIVGPTYRQWIAFWVQVVKAGENPLIVDFSEVTSQPSRAIKLVNQRFATDFSDEFPPSQEVFSAMDSARATALPFNPSVDINPKRPDARKEELRRGLRPLVEQHRLAQRAERLYEDLRALT